MTTFDRVVRTEVAIVGSGVAGQRLALALSPRRVVLLTKGGLDSSGSSPLAQGGIAAAVGPLDSAEEHAEDTLRVGGEVGAATSVMRLTQGGPSEIEYLSRLGTDFTRKSDGSFELGREAAHSTDRILHAHGDQTGKEVIRALSEQVRSGRHIELLEHTEAQDLVSARRRVVGLSARTQEGARLLILARSVVLATGGVGQVYRYTTNPSEVTGDGLAMAGRVGARLVDLEFVQFHPTAIAAASDPLPLATEALRGAGAVLVDASGNRIMEGVHSDLELAPRDIVAREIFRCREEEGKEVFLDARSSVGERFDQLFPTVFNHCQDLGIDPRVEPIPVTPAVHYHMGGVWVDEVGRTSVPGLWAIGEVASTGVHGANRLASNSLLEGLVFGRAAAATLLKSLQEPELPRALPKENDLSPRQGQPIEATVEAALVQRIRQLMWREVGVVRSAAGLARALGELQKLSWLERSASSEARNLWCVARLITSAALARCESRGSHYRMDAPRLDASWRVRQVLTLKQEEGGGTCVVRSFLPIDQEAKLGFRVVAGEAG